MPVGSQLVMQIRYNLRPSDGKPRAVNQSAIRMRIVDDVDDHPAAEDPGCCRHRSSGHMHLLGRSITVELNPGTNRAQTLLDVPNYGFDHQAIVPLDEPVTASPGDTYRVTCTHDVTLRARLPQLRDQPARYVVWGDGTSDEMRLGPVTWSPAPDCPGGDRWRRVRSPGASGCA